MKRALTITLLCCLSACGACSSKKKPAPDTPPADLKEKGLVIDSPAEGATVTGAWVAVSGWYDASVVKFVGVSGAPVDGFYGPTGHIGVPTVFVVMQPNGRFIAPRVPVQEGENTLTVLPFLEGGAVAQAVERKVTGTDVKTIPATVVADPPQATPGTSVKFRASTGDDAEHTWQWDFDGDGVFDDESTAPSHTFDNPGRFAVMARTKVGDAWVYGFTAYTVGKDPKVLLSTTEVTRPTRLALFTKGDVGFSESKQPDVVAAVDGDAVRVFDGALKPKFVISGLSAPKDVDFDDDGRIYVLESGADRISRYLPDGTLDASFAQGGHLAPPKAGDFANGLELDMTQSIGVVGVVLPSFHSVGWRDDTDTFTVQDAGTFDSDNDVDCPSFKGATFTRYNVANGKICWGRQVISIPGASVVDGAAGRDPVIGDFWLLDDAGAVHLYRFSGSVSVGKWTLEYPITAIAIGTDDRLYVAGQGRLEVRDLPRTRPTANAYPEDGP